MVSQTILVYPDIVSVFQNKKAALEGGYAITDHSVI
jgi:hypothetical protein